MNPEYFLQDPVNKKQFLIVFFITTHLEKCDSVICGLISTSSEEL